MGRVSGYMPYGVGDAACAGVAPDREEDLLARDFLAIRQRLV